MTRPNWKHRRRRIYRWLPSWTPAWHDKRRKGLQAVLGEAGDLECQVEQDRIFWNRLLHPEGGGRFWEIGAGDGSTGSHTLGLEQTHGWIGDLTEPRAIPRGRAERIRQCRVMAEFEPGGGGKESWELVAIHRPLEFPGFWTEIKAGRLCPGWLVVENPRPDPRWCRLLEDRGYRLKFFFHDDEYYQRKIRPPFFFTNGRKDRPVSGK